MNEEWYSEVQKKHQRAVFLRHTQLDVGPSLQGVRNIKISQGTGQVFPWRQEKLKQRPLSTQTLLSAPKVPEQQFAGVLQDHVTFRLPVLPKEESFHLLLALLWLWLWLHALCLSADSAALPWGCAPRALRAREERQGAGRLAPCLAGEVGLCGYY